jgi:small nuclear ribonucleoprotein (snRNP)-like protein
MENSQKVVIRFNSGKILKGYVKDFSTDTKVVNLEEAETHIEHRIPISDLKAIFFVKTFEGDSEYRDKKSYGIRKNIGHKIYIKFNDGESLIGFLEGELPWKKGFFLSKPDIKVTGFFLIPVDSESNNIKVFVLVSSIRDITLIT